jgi:hypothetical protein
MTLLNRRPLPGWPGLYIQELTGRQFADIQPLLAGEPTALMAALALASAVSEDGTPIWTGEASPLDAPIRLLKAITDAAVEINGLGQEIGPGESQASR